MANTVYGKAKEAFAAGNLDWDANNIKAALATTAAYTPNFSTDEFMSSVSGIPTNGRSGNLASKTNTLGVLDAADFSFTAVGATTACALILYQDSGSDATSRLLAYYDTGTGLTVTPNGGDINVTVNASGLFAL